jgi:hypothetical protein
MRITCALKQKAEDISGNEYLSKPLLSHKRVSLSVNKKDDAAEYDVYRGS